MSSRLHPAAPGAQAAAALPRTHALQGAHARLRRLRAQARRGIWLEAIAAVALLAAAFAGPSFATDRLLHLEWPFRALLLATFVVAVARILHKRLLAPLAVELTDEELALAVERRAPELHEALISSLQFERDLQGAAGVESSALKAAVVGEVEHRVAAIPFARAIDAARLHRGALGFAAAALGFAAWAAVDAGALALWARRNLLLSDAEWPRYTSLSFAGGPAAVRLPQGDPLTIRIDVDGVVPDQVFVHYVFADGDVGTETASRTGEREFTWTIDAVMADLAIRVQGGDSLPIRLEAAVVERPRIDDLSVRVVFPDYMRRAPELVPPTEGELRLPRGAVLSFAGRSQKDLMSAFLLFADARHPLAVAADGRSFAGDFAVERPGLLVVDVIDGDRLGAGAPPKLSLRVGEDQPPTVEFRLRGVGSSITAHARILGSLRVRDDFGIASVDAAMRSVDEAPRDRSAPPLEVPFRPAEPVFDAPLETSSLRYETTAIVDLMRWNKVLDDTSRDNPIRPGMLFSLRFSARDNYGPGEPHEGTSETMVFRVVTRDHLVEELRRRQVEQRQELQRIAEEERAALLELVETINPDTAGDRRAAAVARFRALARQQLALGRRVAFVGEAYQRILWEYENNRLIESNRVRQIETLIPAPLDDLARTALPATSRLVEAFAESAAEPTRSEAVDGYREILRRIEAVLREMEQAENLAALLEELRAIIKLEGSAIQAVQQRVRDREQDLFGRRDRAPEDSTRPDRK